MLGLVGGIVGYVDHNLTPLFWALIILIALDLLMNLTPVCLEFFDVNT